MQLGIPDLLPLLSKYEDKVRNEKIWKLSQTYDQDLSHKRIANQSKAGISNSGLMLSLNLIF
jgi:hypothetical protein